MVHRKHQSQFTVATGLMGREWERDGASMGIPMAGPSRERGQKLLSRSPLQQEGKNQNEPSPLSPFQDPPSAASCEVWEAGGVFDGLL